MIDSQNNYNKSRQLPTYSQSHVGSGRGEMYDQKMYSEGTLSTAVWQLEKIILSRIIASKEKATYLDFACGTGRVTEYLEYSFQESNGIDISPDMIEAARGKLKKTNLLLKNVLSDDLTGLLGRFDVITSFRFFLNAELELKVKIMSTLASLLGNSGCLIFNIHQHSRSLAYLLKRIKNIFKNKKAQEAELGNWMSMSEIRDLVKKSGLAIIDTYSYAFLPYSLARFISPQVWIKVERFLISKKFHFGSHCIIVCRKTST